MGTVSLATQGATGASGWVFCSVAFSVSASSSACVIRFQHEVSLEEFLGDLECHGSAFLFFFGASVFESHQSIKEFRCISEMSPLAWKN